MRAGEQLTDTRADIASALAHDTRKRIRDVLRECGEGTFTEIVNHLNQSTNKYNNATVSYHLNKMEEGGIIVGHKTVIGGRQVTLYTLSDQYNEVFGPDHVNPDITPLSPLIGLFLSLTILSQVLPGVAVMIYSPAFSLIEYFSGPVVSSKVAIVEVFSGTCLFVTVVIATIYNIWDSLINLWGRLT